MCNDHHVIDTQHTVCKYLLKKRENEAELTSDQDGEEHEAQPTEFHVANEGRAEDKKVKSVAQSRYTFSVSTYTPMRK